MTDYLAIARQAMEAFQEKPERPSMVLGSTPEHPKATERESREEVQPRLSTASELKGQAVELWRSGERFFVVADEEDARLAMDRLRAKRGEIWTGEELEQVARLEDQAARDLIQRFKRQLDGTVTQVRLESRTKGQK